jgi:hypothetical protein
VIAKVELTTPKAHLSVPKVELMDGREVHLTFPIRALINFRNQPHEQLWSKISVGHACWSPSLVNSQCYRVGQCDC